MKDIKRHIEDLRSDLYEASGYLITAKATLSALEAIVDLKDNNHPLQGTVGPQKRSVDKKKANKLQIPDHDCKAGPDDGCYICGLWYDMTDKQKRDFIDKKIDFDKIDINMANEINT